MERSESESTITERSALIILDANIIKGISLRGPFADVLRAIRAAGVERVATPWIAVEEIAAQRKELAGSRFYVADYQPMTASA
ncbi:hypothetical protein [Streptomyces parvus]|uniref:hypothetical protein n=1 Tax=Streptomyces parvus TaxID=66428 RepID=UPI0036B85A94